jgi:hypothetical protein
MPKFLAISESKSVRRRPKALQGETKPESKDREGEVRERKPIANQFKVLKKARLLVPSRSASD